VFQEVLRSGIVLSCLGFTLSSTVAVPLLTAPALADFSGPVVSVLDGDTIEVLHNTHHERVRLSGIACPEKGQAFDNRAKQAASALVFGRDVMLDTHGQDKYGRTLADMILRDDTNVNHELVKEGWCWWDRKYALADSVLEKLAYGAEAGPLENDLDGLALCAPSSGEFARGSGGVGSIAARE
jgi:endonuclease YncB( thermonuclease family)